MKPFQFLKWMFAALPLLANAQNPASYFPPAGKWQTKTPAELGLDAAKIQAAIKYAQANGSNWDFARDQVHTFGTPLGPLPRQRGATNGILLRHGYIVAEFGDTTANEPVYSVAKSFLSTVAGIATDRGLIKDLNDPVAGYIHDGGYDSPHNSKITWKHHLQQTSEWEGSMWGKNSDFVGAEQFGTGQRRPRALQDPGSHYEYNDVRINRFSLSMMSLFGKRLPEVLKDEIMDPIGASQHWKWLPYNNSNGSVSGGTRWGGGLWINSQDLARFGLLILNHGKWDGRQLVSAQWLKAAVTPSEYGPEYGFLWWLNTRKTQWSHGPATSFAAIGNGGNTIWIDPEHDIVLVWHWHRPEAMDGMVERIIAAVTM